MVHFGVELDAPRLLAPDVEGGDAHVLGAGDQFIVVGHARNGVAVRHPHLRAGRKAAHQRIRGVAHGEHRTAVFAAGRGLHLAAESRGEELRAIADAQQRQLALDGRKIGSRSLRIPHGEGAARENHTPHRRVERRDFVEGVNFAIDIQFAHASRNELRVLRSEVENENFFLHYRRLILFLYGTVVASRQSHFGGKSSAADFADAFDTAAAVGAEYKLKHFGNHVIELLARLQRHQRTLGTTLPAMFDTTRAHGTPRGLLVEMAARACAFAELAASAAKQPAGCDLRIHR